MCTLRGKRNDFVIYDVFLSLKEVLIFANSADPDEMQHFVIWICQSTFSGVLSIHYTGLLRSGKNSGELKKSGQGKIREFHFQFGKFRKKEKVREKAGNFKNFPKTLLVNRHLEILFFHKLQAILKGVFQKHSFSSIYG